MNTRRLSDAELEASRWIARLEASDVTLQDHQRFRAWLEASPQNRTAYEAVSKSWDTLDALKLLAPAIGPLPPRPSRRALLLGGGAVVASAGAGALIWAITPQPTFAATYETPVGGREAASLQDGSRIELNASTRARVVFTPDARVADLERGEALFTVAEDPRPFEIRTPFGALAASGVVVLVKVGASSAKVTVLKGRASIARAAVQVNANEEVVLSPADVVHSTIPPARAAQRLAWRQHMLAFDGETLAEAAADVQSQTGVHFEFANDEAASMRIGGYIDARDADAFIALVEDNLSLRAERQSDGVVRFTR